MRHAAHPLAGPGGISGDRRDRVPNPLRFMGHLTIGEPAMVGDNIHLLRDRLENPGEYISANVSTQGTLERCKRKVVFAEYLMRFSKWGRPISPHHADHWMSLPMRLVFTFH